MSGHPDIFDSYGHREDLAALGRLWDDVMRVPDEAPHGRCPECGTPLVYEPRSVEPFEFWGARGAVVMPEMWWCGECESSREPK